MFWDIWLSNKKDRFYGKENFLRMGFMIKKYDFCGLLEGCLKSGSHLQKKKKNFLFASMIALQKLWKMLFIWS